MWKNDWNSDENVKGNYGDNSDAENEIYSVKIEKYEKYNENIIDDKIELIHYKK